MLYHPALTVLKDRAGHGKIIIPRPLIYISYGDTVVRRETDKTLRDWLAITNNYFRDYRRRYRVSKQPLPTSPTSIRTVPPIQKDALQNTHSN